MAILEHGGNAHGAKANAESDQRAAAAECGGKDVAELFQQRPTGKGHDHPDTTPQDEAPHQHSQAVRYGAIIIDRVCILKGCRPGLSLFENDPFALFGGAFPLNNIFLLQTLDSPLDCRPRKP